MTELCGRGRAAFVLAAVTAVLCAVGGQAAAGAAEPAPEPAPVSAAAAGRLAHAVGSSRAAVVVREDRPGAAQAAVRRLGGTVGLSLPLVHGLAATLPAAALPALATAPGIVDVSPDAAVRVRGGGSEVSGAGHPDALTPSVVRAPRAWAEGVTGRGVTVALLDTGIADTPDLAGRIVPVRAGALSAPAPCYDLSGEGSCRDTYGHGTFMAGLIAGNGSTSGGVHTGTAPGARLVSVKVAGASGASDVSTVLAGIQWVVSFRNTYGIRVLNLSLGTDSSTPWTSDPLNYAVEAAWQAGITVVVAASNNGPAAGTVSKPGDDPWVVTVGATDSEGTAAPGDDRLPDFSSRGPTRDGVAKPDVVAPGGRVWSLRSSGSTLQRDFPNPLPGRYRQGSGTSMATAVVSGVAALALQANPGMTPDRFKHALVAAARPTVSPDPGMVGAGLVDAYATALHPQPGAANAGLARSTGTGPIGASRGSVRVQVDGAVVPTVLSGRQTAQLLLWDPLRFVGVRWTPTTWYTSANALVGWNTATWVEPTAGHDWVGHDWVGSSWQGQQEQGTSYGRSGSGSASYGAWD